MNNTILSTLSTDDKKKSFITIFKDGASFDIKISDLFSILSSLLTNSALSSTLQTIKDSAGNSSSLQISTDAIKALKTLTIGEFATSSGTITLVGSLSGQAFYGRDYDGTGTATIFTFYSNGGSFYLYKQIGGSGSNVMSFTETVGYGKFINGTLYASKTTAEINAITTPLESLTFWNSDLKTLCFYDGSSWRKITHSIM